MEIHDNNKGSRDKVVNIIRKVNPDFIITNDSEDYMPDYNAVKILECHESQSVWMREHGHIDFQDMEIT